MVTLIAISYNHSSFIREALQSVIDQGWNEIQWIIIDDCSTDNSQEIIQLFIAEKKIDVQCIFHKENRGLVASLNEGLSCAKGEYLQILACDDVLLENKWHKQISMMRNEGSVACFSNFRSINELGNVIEDRYFPETYTFPMDVFKAILHGHQGLPIVTHSPTGLLKTAAIKETGGYRTDLLQEDFYMWLKLSAKHKISFINEVLISYRVMDRSFSKDLINKKRNRYLEDHLLALNALTGLSHVQRNQVNIAKMNRLQKILNNKLKNEESLEDKKRIYRVIEDKVVELNSRELLIEFKRRNYWRAYNLGITLDKSDLKNLSGIPLVKRIIMYFDLKNWFR